MKKIYSIVLLTIISLAAICQDVYFPPEFEKQEGLLLTWDYNDSRNPITAAIAKAVQPSAKVWVIYYPGTAPMDTTDIRNYLRDHGVPDDNVYLIPGWTETLWIRDYGPFTGYSTGEITGRLFLDAGYSAYGRPKDDSIPTQLANYFNIPVNDFPVEFEGGNFLTDGLGRGWGSTRIFSQNPGMTQQEVKETMEEYLGLDDMMFLEALTNSGGGIWCHVDMFMKILDSETIMISEYPDFVPDYELIESFVDTLEKMTNANGREYKVVRIPAPPKADGNWATTQNDEMRTYTNSIIINDVIVVPSYNLPEYDSTAKEVYETHMPGYRIEMVDAAPLTPLYGALHCIAREVTKPDYLRINHSKITGMQDFEDPFLIEAEVFFHGTLDSAFVHYKKVEDTEYDKIALNGAGNNYSATITDITWNDTLQYYLTASMGDDHVSFPPQGEGGAFTFWFDPSVKVEESFEETRLVAIYPNPSQGEFSITVSGIDFPVELQVFDMTGKCIHEEVLNSGNIQILLPSKVGRGVYTLKIESSGKILAVDKIVIF